MRFHNIQPILRLVKVTASLCILLTAMPELVFAQQMGATQQPANDRGSFPGRRVGGGSRGDCLTNAPLIALSPKANLSKTTTAYPKLYFSLPASANSSQLLRFVLKDEQGKIINRTLFKSSNKAGIVGIDLAEIVKTPLEVNQNYHWYLSMVCNSENHAKDIIVDGWMCRVEPNAEIINSQDKELNSALVRQYQKAGLWNDALTALLQLRQSEPGNKDVSELWTKMLQEEGLEQAINNSFIGIFNQEKQTASSEVSDF